MPPKRRVSARRVACDVLSAVCGPHPQPAELAFERHTDLDRLSARDRAFARTLYATTLRRLGTIDLALRPHLKKWPQDVGLLNCLRLGVTQLRHLETPVHAAIDETVTLAKAIAPFGAKMVNAVLRRVAETPKPGLDPERDLPAWLRERWQKAYGGDVAGKIAAALEPAPLDLTVPSERAEWAARLGGKMLGAATVRLDEAGPIAELQGYAEGAWWVQDMAAAAIVPLLGDIAGKRVLDLCAAPGGKTAQLLAAGAKVTAVEREPFRIERLQSNLARLGMTCEIVQADARRFQSDHAFDAILLDAPCTATGTLRRHPDVAWARKPADIPKQAALQSELLDAASAHLARRGVLVYAVCSLESEEGQAQIDGFLERQSGWQRKAIDPAELANLPLSLSPAGDLRSLPCDLADMGGVDGFFAARLIQSE